MIVPGAPLLRGGILAAGEGSRFLAAGIATPKPLVVVSGRTLLDRTLDHFRRAGVRHVTLVTNAAFGPELARTAATVTDLELQVVAQDTPSSLHTLAVLSACAPAGRLLVTTIDSVMAPTDVARFAHAFRSSPANALLSYTDFVDDEKPLRISLDGPTQRVTGIGETAHESPFVTMGMYGFDDLCRARAQTAAAAGVSRLRRFLALIVQGEADGRRSDLAVAGFRLGKAIDVDRPEDVVVAEDFLEREGWE